MTTVSTISAMKALTAGSASVVTVEEDVVGGVFYWDGTDLSAEITAQTIGSVTYEGIYVAPNSDTTGASGAYKRAHDEAIDAAWFGIGLDGGQPSAGGSNADAISAAAQLIADTEVSGRIVIPGSAKVNLDGTILIGRADDPATSPANEKSNDVTLVAWGARLQKSSDHDMLHVRGKRCRVLGGNWAGGGVDHTGRGIVVTASASDTIILCHVEDTDEEALEIEAGSTRDQILGGSYKRRNQSPTRLAVKFPFNKSTGGNHVIANAIADFIDARGCDNLGVSNCNIVHLRTCGQSRKIRLTGNRFTTTGNEIDWRGTQSNFAGNIYGGDPTFAADLVVSIDGVTKANPGVVSFSGTGADDLIEGDAPYFENLGGMTSLNDTFWRLENITDDGLGNYEAELHNAETGEPLDTSGFSAFTSGGTASMQGARNMVWGTSNVLAGTITELDPGKNDLYESGGEWTAVSAQSFTAPEVLVEDPVRPYLRVGASAPADRVDISVKIADGWLWENPGANIVQRFTDYDDHVWRSNASVNRLRLKSNGLINYLDAYLDSNQDQVVGARLVDPDLGLGVNSGDADTDKVINALVNVITTHGLGKAS